MKNKRIKRTKFVFVYLLLVLSVFFVSSCSTSDHPNVQKGVLDLREWSFSENGSLPLHGEWELEWGKLLSPLDYSAMSAPVRWGKVPEDWHSLGYPSEGVATYRMRVLLPDSKEAFSLHIPQEGSSYRVFANGALLAENGFVTDIKENFKPEYIPQVVPLKTGNEVIQNELELVVQIASFSYTNSGFYQSFTLGTEKEIRANQTRDMHLQIFLLGILLITGLYHLIVFFVLKNDKSALFFALTSIDIALRIFVTGESYLRELFPDFPYQIQHRLEYLTFYAGIPLFAAFVRSVFPGEFNRRVLQGIVTTGIFFSVTALFFPISFYTKIVTFFQVFTIFVGFYMIYAVQLAKLRGRMGSGLFLLAASILFITVANDILLANRFVTTGPLVPVGILIFIFVQSAVLALRFAGAFHRVENFSQELEQKVFERTKDLRKSRDEISRMSEFAREVNESTDVGKIIERILRFAIEEFKMEGAAVLLVDEEEKEYYYYKGFFPVDVPDRNLKSMEMYRVPLHPIQGGVHYKVYERKRAVYLPRIRGIKASVDFEAVSAFRLTGVLIQPLLIQGKVIGVIDFTKYTEPLKLNAHELEQISFFSEQIAGAIYSSLLINASREANEKLLELDRVKTDFFANISHELRTPLTLMLSPVEAVLHGDYRREKDNQFFQNLYRNGLKLLKLINNLLDFSRIEAGRIEMRVSKTDIVRFANLYFSYVEPTAEAKNIQLEKNFPEEGNCFLYIDVEKMDKVFMNLLSNAIKFTGEKGIIKMIIEEREGECVISFTDTGTGILEEQNNSVFERFIQADSGTTRVYEGTGIGLSLAKEFVELHSGTIQLESRHQSLFPDDHGSKFSVTLPKGKEHYSNEKNITFIEVENPDDFLSSTYRFTGMRELHDLARDKKSAAVTENAGERILIVEDNPDMRDFLSDLLSEYYEVITVDNGPDGLASCKEHIPDLIVSDVMMPEMDGHEFTRLIKENPYLSTTPVILLSARAELSQKIDSFSAGADDYLIKPFHSKELLVRVRTLLKNHKRERELRLRNDRIEHDLEVARLIQTRLLPPAMPDISGYTTRAVYIPVDKVGGDFYDVFDTAETLSLFIADVSGHGLASSFFSLITRMSLDSIPDKSKPVEVLKTLNDVMFRSSVKSNFVTSFYASIDKKTKTLYYANAGHLPLLVHRRKTGDVLELTTRGRPLGWFSEISLEEKNFSLESGDRIILYTDGIIEAHSPENNLYEHDRFQNFIRESKERDPQDFINALLKNLRRFVGKESFSDDLALLVVDVE